MDAEQLAGMIDQTLLSPTTGFGKGGDWIDANRDGGFAALCVSPFLVPMAAMRLFDTSTKVCSVAAFPFGYAATEAKADEATRLVELGCVEVDVVVNVAALLEGEYEFVQQDLVAVVMAVHHASDGAALVKVILETGHLSDDEIRRGCEIAVEAGAAFVKTSTGFGPRGASVADVRLMRATVGPGIGVKAAGGIRDLASALAMIEAGASRIGTSAGDAIVAELAARATGPA